MLNDLFRWFLLLTILPACGSGSQQNSEKDKFTASFKNSDKEVVCFLYHRFGNSKYPSTNISIAHFKSHLQYLKEHDFTVMTMDKAIDYLESDGPAKKVAVLTIDDAFETFYDNALPLLKQYGFPATLYVNTETVGGSTYMTWQQIKEAQQTSIEIGNHTHSHAYFLNLPVEERYKKFEKEIEQTQAIMHEKLGITPVTFAYPYGELDPGMKKIVQKAGFKAGAAQNSGVIYSGSDRFALPRFPMASAYSAPDKFEAKAQMHPLKINEENPPGFMLPTNENPPGLQLTFQKHDLQIDQLQCFIQGGDCTMKKEITGASVKLNIRAKKPLQARRTLYTITVPDQHGEWHWFSHLWINPDVK